MVLVSSVCVLKLQVGSWDCHAHKRTAFQLSCPSQSAQPYAHTAMASAHTQSSRLLALPDALLGVIIEKLEDVEDCCAFMHTCKHLHSNPECLSKVGHGC